MKFITLLGILLGNSPSLKKKKEKKTVSSCAKPLPSLADFLYF
jgi:hypothetical protein